MDWGVLASVIEDLSLLTADVSAAFMNAPVESDACDLVLMPPNMTIGGLKVIWTVCEGHPYFGFWSSRKRCWKWVDKRRSKARCFESPPRKNSSPCLGISGWSLSCLPWWKRRSRLLSEAHSPRQDRALVFKEQCLAIILGKKRLELHGQKFSVDVSGWKWSTSFV